MRRPTVLSLPLQLVFLVDDRLTNGQMDRKIDRQTKGLQHFTPKTPCLQILDLLLTLKLTSLGI